MVTVANVGLRSRWRSRLSCSPATVVEVAPSLASRTRRAVGSRASQVAAGPGREVVVAVAPQQARRPAARTAGVVVDRHRATQSGIHQTRPGSLTTVGGVHK